MIMSGHPFIKALAAYWGGAFVKPVATYLKVVRRESERVQGLRCHFISIPGKSPMKLEVTSRHDHSCLLGRKASKQTKQTNYLNPKFQASSHILWLYRPVCVGPGFLRTRLISCRCLLQLSHHLIGSIVSFHVIPTLHWLNDRITQTIVSLRHKGLANRCDFFSHKFRRF